MPHNLLRHVKKDLNQINQKSNQNIRSLRTNNRNTQEVKTSLESSLIEQVLQQNTAKKISEIDLIKFSNIKGNVIRRNDLNLDTTDGYRCSNDNLSPETDSYDDSTKTFTSGEDVKYQVMDFDLKYETYIILTQEDVPKRYILSPNKDVISLSFNKKVYDISEDRFMLNFVFHQASEDIDLLLELDIWKRNGVNQSDRVMSGSYSLPATKGLKTIDIAPLINVLSTGSYYITVTNQSTRSNVEILSNELKIENGSNETTNSQTFIITDRMGGIAYFPKKDRNKSKNRKNKSKNNRKNKSKNKKNKSKNRKNKSKKK